MTHLPYETPNLPLDFVSRRSGLIVCGVLFICMGALAGCLSLAMPLLVIVSRSVPQNTPGMAEPMPMQTALMGVGTYVVMSTALIWLGIGSIRLRRWVRPIVMALCIFLMAIGVLVTVILARSLPHMGAIIQASTPPGAPAPSPMVANFAMTFGMLMSLVMYILIPGIFLWYYRQAEVKRTLEYFDPTARWTDDVPMSVLILGFSCGISGAWMITPIAYGVFPFFGTMVSGAIARIAVGLCALLLIAAAILILRRRMIGWWMFVGFMTLLMISSAVTMLRIDQEQLYAAMDLPPRQVAAIRAAGIWTDAFTVGIGVLSYLIYMGLALYAKPRLRRASTATAIT